MHILYKTINLLNDKYYVGVHKQADPYTFDGYLGSGIALQNSIKKYGRENFKRETLVIGERKYIYDLEEKYLKDKLHSVECYNMAPRGFGGCGKITGKMCSQETRKKISEAQKGKFVSELTKRKIREARANQINVGMKNKKHSEESKRKMSKSSEGAIPWNKGKGLKGIIFSTKRKQNISKALKDKSKSIIHRQRISASQQGKRWFTDGTKNMKSFPENAPKGWYIGRTL